MSILSIFLLLVCPFFSSAFKKANISKPNEELDLFEFRATMLEIHNTLRNFLVSGRFHGLQNPEVGNLQPVSYNLELESLARCWLIQIPRGKDECRPSSLFKNFGQNVFLHKDRMFSWKLVPKIWWDQYYDYQPESVPDYLIPPGSEQVDVRDFVHIVWSSVFQVGCARSCDVKNSNHFVLVCNYADSSNATI